MGFPLSPDAKMQCDENKMNQSGMLYIMHQRFPHKVQFIYAMRVQMHLVGKMTVLRWGSHPASHAYTMIISIY